MKDKLKLRIPLFCIAVLMFAAGCSVLDVVGQHAATTFDAWISSDAVTIDQDKTQWTIYIQDSDVSLFLQKNASSVSIRYPIQPFLDAGLNPELLPEEYRADAELLILSSRFLPEEQPLFSSPKEAFEAIIQAFPEQIGYHSPMDHFNISFGNDTVLEWARDFKINTVTKEPQDKDLVFVLNPKPLEKAGVDVTKVEGWTYAPVTMGMGANEKTEYLLLKPFNLE
jgi:hypothetical protein